MANVEHATLTGAALHEPKGVENASTGQVYVANGSGSGSWTSLASTTPVGAISSYAGTVAPAGWLLCFGQAVSRTTYAELFSVIGTQYGAGNGSTTFNIPDCRGRYHAGKDNMGGSTAGRLTTTYGLAATGLGNSGGSESTTLAQTNIPNYTLPNSLSVSSTTGLTVGGATALSIGASATGSNVNTDGSGTIYQTGNFGTIIATTTSTLNGSITSGGSGTAFSNVPPSIVFSTIIFANA